MRERLPDERHGKTHHFTIIYAKTPLDGAEGTTELEELDGYITANWYPDEKRLGEVFVRVSKLGETLQGMTDGLATIISIALQEGASLNTICSKMIGMRFPPNGATNNPAIPRCTSLLDYLGRWISLNFLPQTQVEGEPAEVIPMKVQP
jgi:hypothetical protein